MNKIKQAVCRRSGCDNIAYLRHNGFCSKECEDYNTTRISVKNLECPYCDYNDHELINWRIKNDTTFTCVKCKKKFKLVIYTEPILMAIPIEKR